ncbi:hypothetical protein [Saccharospirillum impatiens]|uniref:hypothetical protein n=1 Tax=Saccharospirillum impatiens TaxID=169438 RepID=UPI0004134104|nr:hypothetical protein [Saccharospirillum impatiens]
MSDAVHNGNQPIDALVTWVSGEDPVHRAKLNAYLTSIGHRPKIAHENRYRETGEFAYCIASLLNYAPWLRRIHIITDAQEPAFMPTIRESGWGDKVVIVDHTEVFKGHEQALPTFNNRSIMSMHWNISGLAERYVYLNDDFMLVRPVQEACFFNGEQAVLTGHWMPQRLNVMLGGMMGLDPNSPEKRPGNHLAQAYASRLAGFRYRYFKVPHKPHPLLKSVMREYMAQNPDRLAHNSRFPLRDESQFLADALVNHLALKQGRALIDNRFKTLRFKPGDYQQPRLHRMLNRIESDPSIRYACFQSLEKMDDALRPEFFNWLDQHVGKPDVIFRNGPDGVPV